ncbi:MAG TPA: hypothetical protein VLF66_17335 [Thermoanaerobaculia bacterium]|nr:hypothetical protein [Thermoanaerobaculia bacterium]
MDQRPRNITYIPAGEAATLTLVAEYPDMPDEEFNELVASLGPRSQRIARAIRDRGAGRRGRGRATREANESADALLASVAAASAS